MEHEELGREFYRSGRDFTIITKAIAPEDNGKTKPNIWFGLLG
jgi:hypothetical protein